MDLILWRHAEAEDGFPDSERQLTAKGKDQAKRMGAWLRDKLPENATILVSPAIRTQQTASMLKTDFETVHEIAPGATVQDILIAADWPNKNENEAVVVVGHQPTLGETIHHLISDVPKGLKVKKSSVWWIKSDKNNGKPVLSVVMYADML